MKYQITRIAHYKIPGSDWTKYDQTISIHRFKWCAFVCAFVYSVRYSSQFSVEEMDE